jgi:MEMO1 family protein
VAGLFYPRGSHLLDVQVRRYLSAPAPREPAPAPRLRALVVPHAGYVYSGSTAGVGYRLLPPLAERVRRVLLLGPPHRVPVQGLAVSGADEWASPLGTVAVDDVGRRRLLERAMLQSSSMVGVGDVAHAPEHSLEVQIPFLQRTLPQAPVLPVLVGDGSTSVLADLLDEWWADDALMVVSTDLSHYEPDAVARRHDARTSAAVLACDPSGVGDLDACGAQGLRVLLALAARHGGSVRELDRRTSADTAGAPDRVVGYGAFAVEA